MASFKNRPSRLKYRTDVVTLDEVHKNYLTEFEQKQQSIPDKKKKLAMLNKQLETKNTNSNLKVKSKLLSDIKTLESEIKKLEENTDYLEYISKSGDLLVNYYNITSAKYYNHNHGGDELVDLASIPPTVDTETSSIVSKISKTTETDKLKQLNEISKQSRKVKKPVKKRRIIQDTSVSKSIMNFLPVEPPATTENTENTNNIVQENTDNNITNRATLLHKYLMLVDRNYACEKVKADKILYCGNCKTEKTLAQSDGCYVCTKCGETEYVIMESELPSHKELANEKQKYPYKKINHLKEKLNQFQSKESADVPEDICNIVRAELKKRKISNQNCTPIIIRSILKKNKLTEWYEHLQQIYCKISNTKPINLPSDVEETIIAMFLKIQNSFHRHCPNVRSNFLSYSYVLNKLFRILNMPDLAKYFRLLKSKEKLREQDIIWAKICKDQNWKFHSSF